MHFPFEGTFNLGMGIRPLTEKEPLIRCTMSYQNELVLKRTLLQNDPLHYFQAREGTELAQWEVLGLVLKTLACFYPEDFSLSAHADHWTWQNKRLREELSFIWNDANTLPFAPLDWVGRQVQEDLLIVDEQSYLVAGHLCFPSGWSLEEKMGKSFLEMHTPLPNAMDSMLTKAEQLMRRILTGKPLQRSNWGLRLTDQLDLSTKHAGEYARLLEQASVMSANEILGKAFLRIEHQTLTRLPISKCILFTVHTTIERLDKLLDTKEKMGHAYDYLQTVPKEVLEYKMVWPFYVKLMEGLETLKKGQS